VLNILSAFRIFEQIALAQKTVILEFFTILKYFLSFRIFEQLALALKTEFALKFFKPGGAAALPDPPPRTPMTLPVCGKIALTCSYSTKHVGLSDQSKHC